MEGVQSKIVDTYNCVACNRPVKRQWVGLHYAQVDHTTGEKFCGVAIGRKGIKHWLT